MRTLVACPFCREMFEPGEAKLCPECGVKLARLEDLPKTEVYADELEEETPPDEEILPWTYLGRGRGALIAVAIAGIGAFFLPWADLLSPERRVLSGADFASFLGWMWAPMVAWMVLIPLVLSRRSVFKMRGARVAVAFLCAMVVMTVAVRLVFPPRGTTLDPINLEWRAGAWLTLALGLGGLGLAARFGGRLDELSTRAVRRPDSQTLH